MRWERGQDPVATWTTLDNKVVDDDLSCRALGLLTRWLRRPPGAEIDSIPEMVTRAKRSGKKHLEGRDALYAASYELERAGYLVRELVSGATGQHEWVVRIYSQPVPPEQRSDPDDRKRAKRPPSPPAASPQVNPNTDFQESGTQESDSPDSEVPDSADQVSSSKNSQNNSSLSGHTGPSRSRATRGERGAATPESTPADVVVEAYVAASSRPVSVRRKQALRKQAAALLAAGADQGWVAARAAEMPARGWTDLEVHCERWRAPEVPSQATAGSAGHRRSGGMSDAERTARLRAMGSGL